MGIFEQKLKESMESSDTSLVRYETPCGNVMTAVERTDGAFHYWLGLDDETDVVIPGEFDLNEAYFQMTGIHGKVKTVVL